MKKTVFYILAIVFVLGLVSVPATAQDLKVCDVCNGNASYQYHCSKCENSGLVTCTACDENHKTACGNCSGSGKVACKACGGDGQIDNNDGGQDVCTYCNGQGTVDCKQCEGKGLINCTKCGGDGKVECDACAKERANGYKCTKCQGTGYVLVNNPDGPGVTPQKGDRILKNGTYIVVGEETSTTTTTKKNNTTTTTKKRTTTTTKKSTTTTTKKSTTTTTKKNSTTTTTTAPISETESTTELTDKIVVNEPASEITTKNVGGGGKSDADRFAWLVAFATVAVVGVLLLVYFILIRTHNRYKREYEDRIAAMEQIEAEMKAELDSYRRKYGAEEKDKYEKGIIIRTRKGNGNRDKYD